MIVIIRQEDRQDRRDHEERSLAVQTRNNAILDKVADALVEMRITMATRGLRNDGN